METVIRKVTGVVEKPVPAFKGIPLVGDTHLFDNAVACLVANWENEACQYLPYPPQEIKDDSYFVPVDKCGFPLYGLDNNGKVIFGILKFEGDPKEENELRREDHYHIEAKSSVNVF